MTSFAAWHTLIGYRAPSDIIFLNRWSIILRTKTFTFAEDVRRRQTLSPISLREPYTGRGLKISVKDDNFSHFKIIDYLWVPHSISNYYWGI